MLCCDPKYGRSPSGEKSQSVRDVRSVGRLGSGGGGGGGDERLTIDGEQRQLGQGGRDRARPPRHRDDSEHDLLCASHDLAHPLPIECGR